MRIVISKVNSERDLVEFTNMKVHEFTIRLLFKQQLSLGK